MLDHTPIVINTFGGLFDRGQDETCPLDHFTECLNLRTTHRGIKTREGCDVSTTLANIRRYYLYKRLGEADRWLILNSLGEIYDSLNPSTPILSIAGMADFAFLNFYKKAYISPHNGVTGLPGTSLYVYDGSGTARTAAGLMPSGSAITAVSGTSGKVEPGTHLFAVAFETASGFITKPGPTLYTVYEAPGFGLIDPDTLQVNLSGIPTGPAGTVKRYILATRSVEANNGGVAYDGNQNGYEFFFIPNGIINNNVDTTLTVDFYDADLISSADYLFDQFETIAAGVFLSQYGNRLVIGGADTEESVVRFSKKGDPESIDEIEGYCIVDRSESGGVKAGVEYRNSFYIFKDARAYVTQDNLSTEPAFWEGPFPVDKGCGTVPLGVSTILDAKGTSTDRFLVVDTSGVLIFDGYFNRPELTWKIQDIWRRVNKTVLNTCQILNDPTTQSLYITIPLDGATSPSHLLVGDYSVGLASDSIKWGLWSFPFAPVSVAIGSDKLLYVAGYAGNIYQFELTDPDDAGTAIDSYFKTAFMSLNDNGSVIHTNHLRMRVTGSGILQTTLHSYDEVKTATLATRTLSANPGSEIGLKPNFTNEKIAVKVRVNLSGEWFHLTKLIMWAREVWATRYGQ